MRASDSARLRTALITPGLPTGSAKAKPLAFREAAAIYFGALSSELPLSYIWPLSGFAWPPRDAQHRSRTPYDLSGPLIRIQPATMSSLAPAMGYTTAPN